MGSCAPAGRGAAGRTQGLRQVQARVPAAGHPADREARSSGCAALRGSARPGGDLRAGAPESPAGRDAALR